MAIAGYLSELSLPEIFQMLDLGHKTGRLTIQTESNQEEKFYIWFQTGNIVAAGNRTDGQGLLSMIQQRGWITARAATRITEVCAMNQPAGLCLKSQGLLGVEELKQLFGNQVLKLVATLFELPEGMFQFEQKIPVPNLEMTGISASTKEVMLAALRMLKNGKMIKHKLPKLSSGLVNKNFSQTELRLNQLEYQVWELTQEPIAIREIAQRLNLNEQQVQQVALRLMVIGLLTEVPSFLEVVSSESLRSTTLIGTELASVASEVTQNQSFFKELVGFLTTNI
ncbi:hypothetical protein B6N60_00674 [Richelia sinica FACHB-800]|uniref:PatA-like N-terminal domain-containing protein n=1 Tax=Richelia sinica FACHB-800 TaxID=1357546 RepID=A0A975T4D4_9NOST|nr:DUF4388 domain-containing protein [Richelia sinica]MBD2663124.1 DUF4388 domain-containing protein [Richelia sinica FACHB-800]QXE21996.1 hypothetical protein B6N60_00674 [Richelia sinica FACHB-800]